MKAQQKNKIILMYEMQAQISLLQAEYPLKTVQDKISALRRANQCNAKLLTNIVKTYEEILLLQEQVSKQFREIKILSQAIFLSKRWTIGSRVVRLVELLLFRRRCPLAFDRLFEILEEDPLSKLQELVSSIENEIDLFAKRSISIHKNRVRRLVYAECNKISNNDKMSINPVTNCPMPRNTTLNFVSRIVANKKSSFKDQRLTTPTTSFTYCEVLFQIINKSIDLEIPNQILANEINLESMLSTLESSLFSDCLVSIIMPTYNRADTILNSVQTILDQTFTNWELLICDDGSTDNTSEIISSLKDSRICYFSLPHSGAAKARNFGLQQSQGYYIAYLDTDNYWHPHFLEVMTCFLTNNRSSQVAYCDYIDFTIEANWSINFNDLKECDFSFEDLLCKNYIDLNGIVHRKALFDTFRGFDENLVKRQDYYLILKYSWLIDPLHVPYFLYSYRRDKRLFQITHLNRKDQTASHIIRKSVSQMFAFGLDSPTKNFDKVTIISWDMSRNHFSKAYSVAEALSAKYQVELLSFQFFENRIFGPYKDVSPCFSTKYFVGDQFPSFFSVMDRALDSITGDVIYVIKPRLPSLGLALLANHLRQIPFILEINDLEYTVSNPSLSFGQVLNEYSLQDFTYQDLQSPYSDAWSLFLEQYIHDIPFIATHNHNIDERYGNKCYLVRNIKNEDVFNPHLYDRDAIRDDLGFKPKDKIILFGGMLRVHKGINELTRLLHYMQDDYIKLLFVGSRESPDQIDFLSNHSSSIKFLSCQDQVSMAKINYAADLVVLWLNPEVEASHYQMPYKFTDAIAMNTPVIANDISDLGILARQGYLKIVPYGDLTSMKSMINQLFSNPVETSLMCERARRLYLRQFTYSAARSVFDLMANDILNRDSIHQLPLSTHFAKIFAAFRDSMP